MCLAADRRVITIGDTIEFADRTLLSWHGTKRMKVASEADYMAA